MILTDLYERLAVGELSNLAMVVDGTILETERPKIILHANEGLKRIHARFLLKESTLIVDQDGSITNYKLNSKYALSNYVVDAGHTFYINDLGEPFKDDLIRVLEVWDSHGRKLPLNNKHSIWGAFTPQPEVLQLPHPVDGEPIAIQYQAAHPKLVMGDDDQIIDLPEFLSSALTAFIASKVFKHMNTQESTAKGAEHLAAFETNCVEVVQQELVTTGGTTSGYRFEKNGWV